ncbi:3-hydroxyacyl-CoA dehydrogenase NAD-binding domain-containing protein [Kribbella speibonae]|uniref:3-hydroxyacyl-CoA dehydrogenase NAD-binding domain-containing protein n=1 Tax=Kribbella speibonae TaxID=1572660 RepID=UPI001EDEDC47|nr:3-hydroxyacyl-CoA dehydrogenase NAD-binding domain-containing protein [Kribbella speibonae]
MTHVSIIGSGNMGQAIAAVVAKGGNTVELFNSTDKDKPVTGEVVILATASTRPSARCSPTGRISWPARSSSTSVTR